MHRCGITSQLVLGTWRDLINADVRDWSMAEAACYSWSWAPATMDDGGWMGRHRFLRLSSMTRDSEWQWIKWELWCIDLHSGAPTAQLSSATAQKANSDPRHHLTHTYTEWDLFPAAPLLISAQSNHYLRQMKRTRGVKRKIKNKCKTQCPRL